MMNNPSHTDLYDENLMQDLQKEFMEMARQGNYEALCFAEEESSYFRSTIRGVVMGIIRAHLPGRHTILEALSGVASIWATQEFPKRVAALRQGHEDVMQEAEGAEGS